MAGVIAELLAEQGFDIIYATPASEASTWTRNTMEQHFIQKRLMEKGVAIRSFSALDAIGRGEATLSCTFTAKQEKLEVDAVVPVTARLPDEQLFLDLKARADEWSDAGIEQVVAIGDAQAPATIAHATYAGRRFAEELDMSPLGEGVLPFKREIAELVPLD
jgi:dimethylamine/trimethylamine dehydrogenase